MLWFEPDLFDQLQLLQVLSQIRPETAVELVQADDYLGRMDAAGLEALWPARRRWTTRPSPRRARPGAA